MEGIKVSVVCATYNQVSYISEAIESFLMQKTSFEYEIIIHDDASTDGTSEIVKKYVNKYPNKVFAILQNENQYSQGVQFSRLYIHPMVRGKYIAICEGDDFWTDPYKIQKQYDYMEKNQGCSLCIHDGYLLTADKSILFHSKPMSENPKKYYIEDAIMGIGTKVVTNSFFYRTELTRQERPQFVEMAPAGDFVAPIHYALNGYIYYMPEKMAAHRALAINSFSSTMGRGKESRKKWEVFYQRQYKAMKELDYYTNYKHSKCIHDSYINQRFYNYLLTNNRKEIKRKPYCDLIKNISMRRKLELYIPFLFRIMQRIHYFFLKGETKRLSKKYEWLN